MVDVARQEKIDVPVAPTAPAQVPPKGLSRFKKVPKVVKFQDGEVSIVKLTVSQVMSVQTFTSSVRDEFGNILDTDSIKLNNLVVRCGCPEFTEESDDALNDMPMEDIAQLAQDIMIYSGIVQLKE